MKIEVGRYYRTRTDNIAFAQVQSSREDGAMYFTGVVWCHPRLRWFNCTWLEDGNAGRHGHKSIDEDDLINELSISEIVDMFVQAAIKEKEYFNKTLVHSINEAIEKIYKREHVNEN